MPRFETNKKKKKISKRLFKKKYNLSVGKLLTTRIDSALERRMKQIAEDTHDASITKLIYRQYLMGTYDRTTNIFGIGSFIDWRGIICPLAQIQKLDNATNLTLPVAPNPEQTPTSWVNPGANVVAPVTGRDGFRIGNQIKIHGISINMNIEQPRILDQLAESPEPPEPVLIPTYTYAHIRWGIVTAKYDGSDAVAAQPQPEDVLDMPIYGWSSKLDKVYNENDLNQDKIIHKTIYKDDIRMKISFKNSNIYDKKYYIDLKDKPLIVTYNQFDQNGQVVVGAKPFLVFRSSIPRDAGYDIYKPRIRLVCKAYYSDV